MTTEERLTNIEQRLERIEQSLKQIIASFDRRFDPTEDIRRFQDWLIGK